MKKIENVAKCLFLVILYLGLYLAVQSMVSLVALSINASRMTRYFDYSNPAEFIHRIFEMTSSDFGVTTLVSAVVFLALVLLLFWLRERDIRGYMRLNPPKTADAAAIMATALGMQSVTTAIVMVLALLIPPDNYFEAMQRLSGNQHIIWLFIGVGVVGPILEEILFRGLIQTELRRCMPLWAAIAVQAALFGAVHVFLIQASYAFVIGLVLGYVYAKTNSFYIPVIMHITFNCSSVIIDRLGAGLPTPVFYSASLLFLAVGAVYFIREWGWELGVNS